MEKKRKIEIIGRKVNFQQAEDDDLFYWADRTWQERIAETERLRRLMWTYRLGTYSTKFEKTGSVILKSELDNDDF